MKNRLSIIGLLAANRIPLAGVFLTTLVLAIIISGSSLVDAQEDAGAKTELASAQAPAADQTHEASTKFAVTAAYYGEMITHPGEPSHHKRPFRFASHAT